MGFSPVFKIKAFSHNCLPLCSCQSYLWWAWPLQSPDLSCPPKLLVQPLMLLLPSQPPLSPLGLFYHFLSKNILYTCIIEPSKRQIVVKIWISYAFTLVETKIYISKISPRKMKYMYLCSVLIKYSTCT